MPEPPKKYLRELKWKDSTIDPEVQFIEAEHPDLGPYGRIRIYGRVMRHARGHLGPAGCYTCTASVACFGDSDLPVDLFNQAAELPAPGYGYFATPHEALGAALAASEGASSELVGLIYSEAGWK